MQLGFDVNQYSSSDATFQRDLDRAKTINPGCMIRLDAVPDYLYNGWSDLDRRVGRVTDRGLVPHLMAPYWMHGHGKSQPSDPTVVAQYVQFCRDLGARYDPRGVKSVELGNEANRKGDFAPDGAKPEFQAELALKVSPVFPASWTIVSMAMAPAPTGSGSLSPTEYLKRYWPICGTVLDACAIHPYGRSADAGQSWSTLGQIPYLRSLTKVPFWCTEYNGWTTPDTTNALWVAETLPWLAKLKDGPKGAKVKYVDRTFIYAMSDPGTDNSAHLGVYTAGGTARPVLKSITDWLATQGAA